MMKWKTFGQIVLLIITTGIVFYIVYPKYNYFHKIDDTRKDLLWAEPLVQTTGIYYLFNATFDASSDGEVVPYKKVFKINTETGEIEDYVIMFTKGKYYEGWMKTEKFKLSEVSKPNVP